MLKIIFVLSTLGISALASRGCHRICGEAKEAKELSGRDVHRVKQDVDNSYTKIVNGWISAKRPWMALLLAFVPEGPSNCVGALINDRFIMTALHCVCHPPGGLHCVNNKPSYDIRQTTKAYLGINDNDAREIVISEKRRKIFEHNIADNVIPPDWSRDIEGLTLPDVSLLRLERKVRFRPGHILPICIPKHQHQYRLHDARAYVAGWGQHKMQQCYTDNYGPSRHARCMFPFKYNGLTYLSCQESSNPSSQSEWCSMFEKARRRRIRERESVKILFGGRGGTKTTKCYPSTSKYGWCGVCDKQAAFKKAGQCRDDSPAPTNPAETVQSGHQWGFCRRDCAQTGRADKFSRSLREASLTIMTKRQCEILNSPVANIQQDYELCAGLKFPFPKMKVYSMHVENGRRRKFRFRYKKTQYNLLGTNQEKARLGFYVGYSDSCFGDSGAPLYQFHKGRAYLSGVLSRGDECGGFNQPGIYTKVVTLLQWIKDSSRKGHC